jgi:hypothetical protein
VLELMDRILKNSVALFRGNEENEKCYFEGTKRMRNVFSKLYNLEGHKEINNNALPSRFRFYSLVKAG